jgi:hypothetical protein
MALMYLPYFLSPTFFWEHGRCEESWCNWNAVVAADIRHELRAFSNLERP